jgi:Low psii accumulation1 / Rep27
LISSQIRSLGSHLAKMKVLLALLALSYKAEISEGFAIERLTVSVLAKGTRALSNSPADFTLRSDDFSGSGHSGTSLTVSCIGGSRSSMTQLSMSGGGGNGADNDKKQYSRDLYLREEAESPFRKVRFFVYTVLAGGALTSLAVSGARVAAGLSGINTDLLSEALTNVDVVGLGVLAVLFQRDLDAQESRLKRASKGAELAKLQVRASKRLIAESDLVETRKPAGAADGRTETFTVNLSSLRRGRGIEKRVVIAVGGSERVARALDEASRLREQLEVSDLLVVPVVLPSAIAPEVTQSLPDCVALPVGASWLAVVQDEAEEARKQGVDVTEDGFCVILKKNGRVGQRTKGIFLAQMVGEVESRKAKGFDVANI